MPLTLLFLSGQPLYAVNPRNEAAAEQHLFGAAGLQQMEPPTAAAQQDGQNGDVDASMSRPS